MSLRVSSAVLIQLCVKLNQDSAGVWLHLSPCSLLCFHFGVTKCDMRVVAVRSLWCSQHTPEVSEFTAVQQKNIQEHLEHKV